MTTAEFKDLKAVELAKLETLEKILELLDKLEAETDADAVEWVVEKINE